MSNIIFSRLGRYFRDLLHSPSSRYLGHLILHCIYNLILLIRKKRNNKCNFYTRLLYFKLNVVPVRNLYVTDQIGTQARSNGSKR
nr:MAG TPA: hypothetical protein [Caudoviricetes sp.]